MDKPETPRPAPTPTLSPARLPLDHFFKEVVRKVESEGAKPRWEKKSVDNWHPAAAMGCDSIQELVCVAAEAMREGNGALWSLCFARALSGGWESELGGRSAELALAACFGRSPEQALNILSDSLTPEAMAKGAARALLALALEMSNAGWDSAGLLRSFKFLCATPGVFAHVGELKVPSALKRASSPVGAEALSAFEKGALEHSGVLASGKAKKGGASAPQSL